MSDIPLKPGYYWAKWKIPSDDTPEREIACPCDDWEIVQVNTNTVDWHKNPADMEALTVFVCGVSTSQWRDCFVWGPWVAPLNSPTPESKDNDPMDGPCVLPGVLRNI